MAGTEKIKKRREINRIIDESGDPKYFVMIPRLIWARARDTFDYTFYAVVKDIAGENGECWLGTEDLARLCKMSEGKAADCREFWLSTGFITGELQSVGEGKFVWHLKICNIWEDNRRWSEDNPTIDDRIDHAVEQREQSGKGYVPNEKTCKRCHTAFTATGRRSKRCPTCAKQAQIEQTSIYKIIKMPIKDFIPADTRCATCGAAESIEPHLEDIATHKIIFLCESCHDTLHAPDEKVHGMNLPGNGIIHGIDYPKEAPDNSSDELSQKIIHGIVYPPLDKLWDESKNNQLIKNHTGENNQERAGANFNPPPQDDTSLWAQIWQMITDQLEMQMRRDRFAMYVKPAFVAGVQAQVLQIGVPSNRLRDWNNDYVKRSVDRLLVSLAPPDSPVREVSFVTAQTRE